MPYRTHGDAGLCIDQMWFSRIFIDTFMHTASVSCILYYRCGLKKRYGGLLSLVFLSG
jgi:hypothetical protein